MLSPKLDQNSPVYTLQVYQISAGSEYALASFVICAKRQRRRRKNEEKTWNFGLSYLGNTWHDLLQFWNPASPYRHAVPQQIWWSLGKRSRIYECVKISTLLFLLIYSLPFARPGLLGLKFVNDLEYSYKLNIIPTVYQIHHVCILTLIAFWTCSNSVVHS